MGFFSKLTNSLFGNSEGKANSQSGFSLLPTQIQNLFKDYSSDVSSYLPSAGGADLFTPLSRTEDENKAYSMIRQGFTPTQDSLNTDISMLMNPFDDFVIDDVNRQAGSEYSILKQAMNSAGQLGSNRGLLGANDIEQTRLGTIGKLRQDQYNKALDSALTTLPGLRENDAANSLGLGESDRSLDTQTRQAPIQNLLAIAQLMGVLPQSGGSTETRTENSNSGLLSGIASLKK